MPTPVQLAWVEAAADATVWHTHTQRHTHGCNYQPLLHGLPCWLGFSPDSKPFTANTLHFPARSPSLRKPLHIVSCAAAAAATARCNYTLSAVWYLDWLNIWRGFFIPKRRFSGGLKIGPRKQRKDRLLRSPRRKWALLWAQFVSSKTIGGLPAKREGFYPPVLQRSGVGRSWKSSDVSDVSMNTCLDVFEQRRSVKTFGFRQRTRKSCSRSWGFVCFTTSRARHTKGAVRPRHERTPHKQRL